MQTCSSLLGGLSWAYLSSLVEALFTIFPSSPLRAVRKDGYVTSPFIRLNHTGQEHCSEQNHVRERKSSMKSLGLRILYS